MSDILDRLRGYADSRLYALPGQYVCDVSEILNEHAALVTRLATAEAAIGTLRELVGCRSRNVGDVDMPTHTREIMEAVRHRAERAERVVEAVRVFFERAATIHGETVGKQTMLELARLYDALNAFDAAEAP